MDFLDTLLDLASITSSPETDQTRTEGSLNLSQDKWYIGFIFKY